LSQNVREKGNEHDSQHTDSYLLKPGKLLKVVDFDTCRWCLHSRKPS